MLQKNVFLITSILLLLKIILFTGCINRQDYSMNTGNIYYFRLSNPDETFYSIRNDIKLIQPHKYKYNGIKIKTTEREKRCYIVGTRFAKAHFYLLLKDYNTVRDICESIIEEADKLDFESDKIKNISLTYKEDFDDKRSFLWIKQFLNNTKNDLIQILNCSASRTAGIMLEFGIWIETICQISNIVHDEYSLKSAAVLLKKNEAEYFKALFGSIKLNINVIESDMIYEMLFDVCCKLVGLMEINEYNSISMQIVNSIHALTSRVNNNIINGIMK